MGELPLLRLLSVLHTQAALHLLWNARPCAIIFLLQHVRNLQILQMYMCVAWDSAVSSRLATLLQTKQYKKGIKNADAILKKFPEHGETLAMKVCAAPA